MKFKIVLLATVLFQVALSEPALWPEPVELQAGNEVLWIDHALSASFRCGTGDDPIFQTNSLRKDGPFHQQILRAASKLRDLIYARWSRDEYTTGKLSEINIVRSAAHVSLETVQEVSFVPWKFHKRAAQFEPDLSNARRTLSALELFQKSCPSAGDLDPESYFQGDESYDIVIYNNTAHLRANGTLGTLRALETFKQLFYAHSTGTGTYTPHMPLHIFDFPRWPHRGLSLDIARNVFAPKDALRTIDALATAKFSRLHIHATDSQSWPIEIPSLPDLATKGAYRSDSIWTTSDLGEVQAYGASRGISVFIEIDMPGHTAAVAHAYPDLIAAFNEPDWSTFAAEPLSGQLKLNSTSVRSFIETLLSDLLPRVSKYTNTYHAGGDEVNIPTYLLDETVRSNDTVVLQPLLQALFDQIFSHIIRNNLRPIVWEEMILDWNLTLLSGRSPNLAAKNTLVQVWRNSENIEEILKRGYSVIFGDFLNWYLDCGMGGFLDPYPSGSSPPGVPYNTSGGVRSRLKEPYLDYCSPLHNWRQIYTYNPLEKVKPELREGVEGGEVLMWSEQTDPVDLDVKLWPRAAAAAEVLWLGPRAPALIEGASKRLGHWRERLVADYGISSSPVHMTWCHMEGGCQY